MDKHSTDVIRIDDYEYGTPLKDIARQYGLDEFASSGEDWRGDAIHGLLKMRQFNLGRLGVLLATGTDRDETSDSKHYNGLYDAEIRLTQEDARRTNTRLDRYTYANTLWLDSPGNAALYTLHDGVAIYRYDSMTELYGDNINGLHRFDVDPREALVAVIRGSEDLAIHEAQLKKNHPGVASGSVNVANLRGQKRTC